MKKTKITALGKFIRKIRIDNGEYAIDMAKRLGVTPQYISLVELGKRKLNTVLKNKFIEEYKLNNEQKLELERIMMMESKKINIDIEGLDIDDVNLLLLLSNKMKNMEKHDKDKFKNIINNIERREQEEREGVEKIMPVRTGENTMIEIEITDEDKAFNFIGKSLTGRQNYSNEYGFEIMSLSFSKDRYIENIESKLRDDLYDIAKNTLANFYNDVDRLLKNEDNKITELENIRKG